MKQKSLIILTFTIVMLMTFTLSAMAGNHGGKHHKLGMKGHDGMGLKFLKALNLTDDQKKMTAEIIGTYKDAIKTNIESMMTSQNIMSDTISNQSHNEEAVRQAFKDTVKYREELVVIRAKILTELKTKVFTQEQVQQLETLRADRNEKMKQRVEDRISGIEDWLENLGQ